MARIPHKITGYKIAVLKTLDCSDPKRISEMGGSPPHLTRALRELEEDGLVGRSFAKGTWSLMPAGRELLNDR